MTRDQIFTPTAIARSMVASVSTLRPTRIADFSVGDGELLRAAAERWEGASFIGVDIDVDQSRRLRRAHPAWQIAVADFLDDDSVKEIPLLRAAFSTVDLVLLNPPFSCRGGRTYTLTSDGETFRVSQALAFVFKSLAFLSRKGTMVAVLPIGSLSSAKDAVGWRVLRRELDVDVRSGLGNRVFSPYSARTALVVFRRQPRRRVVREAVASISQSQPLSGVKLALVRGRNQLHKIRNDADENAIVYPLVHTTSIKQGAIIAPHSSVRRLKPDVARPSVLIPRVGMPSVQKLVVTGNEPYCLSDCLFAITCANDSSATYLCNTLVKWWHEIELLYVGTGAPYLTTARLKATLESLGALVA